MGLEGKEYYFDTKSVLSKNVLLSPSNDRIALLDKKTGEVIKNPKGDKNTGEIKFSEEDVDWSGLSSDQLQIMESNKKEMRENLEFKHKELIDSGCAYTQDECQLYYIESQKGVYKTQIP